MQTLLQKQSCADRFVEVCLSYFSDALTCVSFELLQAHLVPMRGCTRAPAPGEFLCSECGPWLNTCHRGWGA